MTALAKTIPAAKRRPHPDYLALTRRFPPRVIRTNSEYHAAATVLDKLAVRDEDTLSAGEAEYLDLLTALVERYDAEHKSFDESSTGSTPVDSLKALMEHRGVSAAQLSKIVGSQPAVSMILSGKREISKEQAKKLALFFRVDVGAFI